MSRPASQALICKSITSRVMDQNERRDIEKLVFASGVKLELIGGKKVKTARLSLTKHRVTRMRGISARTKAINCSLPFPCQ